MERQGAELAGGGYNEYGLRRLGAAVVLQALKDLDDLYLRVERIHHVCGHCQDRDALREYLEDARKSDLPWGQEWDADVLPFFQGHMRYVYLGVVEGVEEEWPSQITQKLQAVDDYYRTCLQCVARIQGWITGGLGMMKKMYKGVDERAGVVFGASLDDLLHCDVHDLGRH